MYLYNKVFQIKKDKNIASSLRKQKDTFYLKCIRFKLLYNKLNTQHFYFALVSILLILYILNFLESYHKMRLLPLSAGQCHDLFHND